jgi:hypothetical protein
LERLAQLESEINNGLPQNLGESSSGNAEKTPTVASLKPEPVLPAKAVSTNVPNSSASIADPHSVSNFLVPARSISTALPEKPAENDVARETSNEVVKAQITKIETKDGDDVRLPLQTEIERRNLMWLSISLEKANFVKISGNKLLLEFAANNKQYQATWESVENAKTLGEICLELFGRKLEIVAELTGQAKQKQVTEEESAKQNEKDDLWKLAESDPTVQTILKTFRGKIIEVWREEEAEKLEN